MNQLKYLLVFVFLVGGTFLFAHVAYTSRYNARKTAFRIVQSLRLISFNKQEGKEIEQTLTLTDYEHKGAEAEQPTNQPIELRNPEYGKLLPEKSKDKEQKQAQNNLLLVKPTMPPTEHANKPADANAGPAAKGKGSETVKPKSAEQSSKQVINKPTSSKKLPDCSKPGKDLVGLMYVDQTVPDMQDLEKQMSIKYGGTVEKGGWWRPSDCKALAKVAIIIPYRNRIKQLQLFLKHMHPMLQRQLLDYRIFVIEQATDNPFNRAGLFNVGFQEALKMDNYDCFIFSDVDLLPEDDRNNYGCPTSPRHMSVAVDKFNYQLPYASIFGGVGAFKKNDFEVINGFSNLFWGWGGEDDDLYQRIRAKGFQLSRPPLQIGRYTMVKVFHFQSSGGDPNRHNLLTNSASRMSGDGLNTLKYERQEIKELPLVTIVTVNLLRG